MLVTALVLAVSFLAVAVLLNGVIYSENLATRGEDARGSEAISYRADVLEGAEQLVEYANRNNTDTDDYDDPRQDFRDSLDSMNNATAPVQAIDGLRTDVSVVSMINGTRIVSNASEDFTNEDGDSNWTLASGVQGTRAFRINVTDLDSSDPFTVRVNDTNSTDEWTVEIYENGTIVDHETETCTTGADPDIDLTAGTVDGQPCDALTFADGVSTPYAIEFENADEIEGNFALVVNSTTDDDPDSPFAHAAVYAATIHVVHESPDHVYETDIRVAPGENDA